MTKHYSAKQFIFDRLFIAEVKGVFTKDIAMGMLNARVSLVDVKRAFVVSAYQGINYLLSVRFDANDASKVYVEEIASDKDYHEILEKYMFIM